jgi:hypothetical protein
MIYDRLNCMNESFEFGRNRLGKSKYWKQAEIIQPNIVELTKEKETGDVSS